MTTAIVMVGRPDDHVDPLAAAAGLDDKCVLLVGAQTMTGHMPAALCDTSGVTRIIVLVNDPAVLEAVPEVRDLPAAGRVAISPARANLANSLKAAIETVGLPIFITTADNVMLTAVAAAALLEGATDANVAVAFARREVVLAAYTTGQCCFYRSAEGSYSICKSYWIGSRRAPPAAEVFRGGGQFAQHPLRIVEPDPPPHRYAQSRLRPLLASFSIDDAPVILSDGAVAIDVDNTLTLRAAGVLAERGSALSLKSAVLG